MPDVKPDSGRPRGRPPSAAAHAAILEAASQILAEGGIGAVTIEAVAHRAGVGKPTIYRRWPDRGALAMAALMATSQPPATLRETASALDDLGAQLRGVIEVFSSARGRSAALMVASADPGSELAKAFRNQVMLASREDGRAILKRAIATGEVRASIDIDVVLDMIYGPVLYRLLIGHAGLGETFTNQLMNELRNGIATNSVGPR